MANPHRPGADAPQLKLYDSFVEAGGRAVLLCDCRLKFFKYFPMGLNSDWRAFIMVVVSASLIGCAPSTASKKPAASTMKVAVSILPQAYFAERIGGRHIDILVLVGPGQSPATYEPSPKQMTSLSHAKCLFRVGLPFENMLLKKVSRLRPDLKVIDTRKDLAIRSMDGPHHGTVHRREGMGDPHIWLNPRLVKVQARTICDTLSRLDPAHAQEFAQNLEALQSDLDVLDARISTLLAPLRGKDFFVFHPSYGYFGDAYGLHQVPIETDGKPPGIKQLAAIIARARIAGVKGILVQRQFASGSAQAVADAIGGVLFYVDPLARNYLVNLVDLATAVARSLGHMEMIQAMDRVGPQ